MIEDWPVDPLIDIHIELLPEFGFTVQNEPVYGPGSVFQGNSALVKRGFAIKKRVKQALSISN